MPDAAVYAFPTGQGYSQPVQTPQPQAHAPSTSPVGYPSWNEGTALTQQAQQQQAPPPQGQAPPPPQQTGPYPGTGTVDDPVPVKLMRLVNAKAQEVPWWVWLGVGVGVTFYLSRKASGKPIISFGK